MVEPCLQIASLGFRFDARLVFHEFSATLGPGITWLRGPNGQGKTTLLRLVAGALEPNTGTISMDGVDSASAPLAYRLNSFFCGGDVPELPWLKVQEFLDIHLALYPKLAPVRVASYLNEFGIGEVLGQELSTLSLGQHKKVQLSLALALPVRLLLVDEPFNGLDAAAITYLRAQLEARVAGGESCIILTSHMDPAVTVARTIDL
jgi:ABC-2 type transport system ATP-binding protein